ncbi:MAG: hypothetical protein GY913_27675 [Proteobacteria bacterium]|nr:hypothetical protein [Pseudomonadota bacterium]MCP4920696.1 hypothetical protein [Pseudomonadota bacterium]
MSPKVRRLLFALVPVVVLLGAAEGLLHLVWNPVPRVIEQEGTPMRPHPTRIWGLDPTDTGSFGVTYAIDEDGLRKTRVEGHDLRAMTVGDSSVFGHGLPDEHTLHDQLQTALGRHGVGVDVLSGAVPGYSSEQALSVLDELGWDKDLDLLIIGTLWSDNGIRNFSDREWMASLQATRMSPSRLFERSYLVRFSRRLIKPPTEENLPVDWVRDPLDHRRRRVLLDEYAENLETMMLQAAERDVSVIFLSPCNRDLLYEFAEKPTVWTPYFQAMEMLAERRNVPLVRGCDELRAMRLTENDAFIDRMHPTQLGNKLYANGLAGLLLANGWPEEGIVPDASVPRWTEPLEDTVDPLLTDKASGGQVDRNDDAPRP